MSISAEQITRQEFLRPRQTEFVNAFNSAVQTLKHVRIFNKTLSNAGDYAKRMLETNAKEICYSLISEIITGDAPEDAEMFHDVCRAFDIDLDETDNDDEAN